MKVFKKLATFVLLFTIVFAFSLKPSYSYAKGEYVYLGGFTTGFNIDTEGVTVVGLTEIFTEKGVISPSKNSDIKVGDIILSINGVKISTVKDVYSLLKNYKDGYMVLQIERKGIILLKDVFPEKDMTGAYKLGVFLRDDVLGLGTVTYVEENGDFASLGHPVTDENGRVYLVTGGYVYNCSIVGVNKAVRGKAGELKGLFMGDTAIGKITANSAVGLYGNFTNFDFKNSKKIEIGSAKVGSAKILSTIDGDKPKYYDIDILKSDLRTSITKNLVIKITDKQLIEYTGGILQGMSGSPIIQDNKIVGAVTHVFVNDSTRGYGISIENMLKG